MATTPSLRRTSARSRAVSPPLNLPALQPSTNVDDSKRMLQHHVAHPEKSAPSDVKIKVIIKRIDHVDTEKQVRCDFPDAMMRLPQSHCRLTLHVTLTSNCPGIFR
jgi:hypothetical protein